MISAIVLGPDAGGDGREREWAVRSLAWLVSGVVAGVVRDVTVACAPSWQVEDVIDLAGCAFVQAPGEAQRIAGAAATAKCGRVLVLRLGFQPQGPLVEEIDALERRSDGSGRHLLLAAPATLWERLFPDRAAAVGVLVPRAALEGAPSFAALVAGSGRQRRRLATRLVPVL